MIQSQLFFNKCFDKNKLKGLISWSLRNYGEATTLDLVEKLKNVGFFWATQAGISLSIDDLKIPKEKSSLLLDAEKLSKLATQQFSSGNLTTVERLQQMIDAWHRTSENLKQEVVSNFRRSDPLNPVYMMAFSGARGNISQVRQLVGMRGLMADPQGRIIDFPIRSNFREGLTLTEYVISCYGARKGIVDTALRTATSGYLTRRLVDVAQHIVVSNYDCGTEQGIPLSSLKQGSKILLPLSERILGRVLAEDLEGVALRNTCVSQYLSSKVSKSKESVLVRSPLLCKSKNGVCQLCYGWSLAHNELVSIGEAVGIIAAQSIGEPGTQLTMRTFHTGGVFSGEIIDQIQSPQNGTVRFRKKLKGSLVRTSYGKIGFLTREAGSLFIECNEMSNRVEEISFPVQSILFVRQGQKVEKNEIVLEYASAATDQDQGIQATHLVTAPQKGEVFFEDVVVVKEETNVEAQAYQLGSFWLLTSHLHVTAETLNGSFRYSKGDFITQKSSLVTTKLVNTAVAYPTLVQPQQKFVKNESYNAQLPFLNTKLFNLPIQKLTYSSGTYLANVNPSFVCLNYVASQKRSVFHFVNQMMLSLPSLTNNLNQPVESNSQKKSNLFFLFSTSAFWFLCQKSVERNEFFNFRKKLVTFASLTSKTATSTVFKSTKVVKKVGLYSFKNRGSLPNLSLNEKTNKFYTSATPSDLFTIYPPVWEISKNQISFFKKFESSHFLQGNHLVEKKVKPVVNQLPVHFLLYCFSRRQTSLPLYAEQLLSNSTVNKLKLFKLSQKAFCFVTIPPGLNSFVSYTAIANKQSLDKSLFTKPNVLLNFEPIYQNSYSQFGLQQIQNNALFDNFHWGISQTEFDNINVYGETKLVLPINIQNLIRVTKTEKSNFFEWNLSNRKLVLDNLILGQIDKKTFENIEIFKVLDPKIGTKLLSLKKQDCCAINVSKISKSRITAFLGSLIRPGKELIQNSTIQSSGQILSIGKNAIVIRKALPILFSSKANFHVFHGDFIEKGLPLITLTYKRLTTGDIVQGIPRIEQLFEARQTTTVLHEQLHELFETYKTRMRLDLAARKSFQKIQRILIDSIQRVYQTQGVTISDKHLEIIVRQMTSTVRILEGGRTRLLRGELKPIEWIEKVNLGIDIQKAEYEPILLGITKASLETESFISASSFQETTRTLSRAAIEGRTDFLRGLKENVILGHRVPAGTGAPLINYLTKFSSDLETVEDVSTELNFLLKE